MLNSVSETLQRGMLEGVPLREAVVERPMETGHDAVETSKGTSAKSARSTALWLAVHVLFSAVMPPAALSAPTYGYEVIDVFPHDPEAFTQGLIFRDGFLYEGTGGVGTSSLRKVVLETGQVIKRYDVPEPYFGEGITAMGETFFQLTWMNYVAFTYVEEDTFRLTETFPYEWRGWGLADDATHLIASDGSATVRFLDPETRELMRAIDVHDEGQPVLYLNELEYIQGSIYANVYNQDRLALIDPASGAVQAWIDLGGLRDSVSTYPSATVLNGIAYDPVANRLFVTGKRWPKLFEIDVEPLHWAGVEEPDSRPMREALRIEVASQPCRGRIGLTLDLPHRANVCARLFDPQGRMLGTLLQSYCEAGAHTLLLDRDQVPDGVYFLRVVVGRHSAARRILLVK